MRNMPPHRRPGVVPQRPTIQPLNIQRLLGVLLGASLMLLGFLGLCYCIFLYFHH
ncbi:hypothetical protein [Dictyobacter aurantiacus]|uniref:Uncharacterized protein n=1 Tax=Dictyobacter aurantiacus TaxID=1936993 RepID=A0A401ZAS2_9CHLR|nr:hypothetical protein [Dictyobacter aurantiacus]GCE03923.1 hypothetical protein KDAU_12520 [Dictyobacter aurantiacus]